MSNTTIYRALLVTLGLLLLNIANQATRQGKAVQTVEIEVTPRDYYPARDTSFLRYLCCGVVGR